MNSIFGSIAGIIEFRADSPVNNDRSAEFAGRLLRAAKFTSLSASEGSVRGTVPRVYFPAVRRISEKLGMSLTVTRERGIYYLLKKYSRRTGFIIGAFFAFALTVFF